MSDPSATDPSMTPPATPEASASPTPDGTPGEPLIQPYPGAPPIPASQAAEFLPPEPVAPRAFPPAPPHAFPGGFAPPPEALPGAAGGARDTRPRTLAILALVFAIVGAVLAFVPIISWFTWPLFITAIVLALIALISRRQGGKGLGIAALITTALSGFVSTAMVVAPLLFVLLGGLSHTADADRGYRDDGGESAPQTSQGADLDLEIVEASVGRDATDQSLWWFAVVVDNPNDDAVFDYADITVDALDAGGATLDTSSEYRAILPGRTVIVGYFFDVGTGDVSSVTVDLPDADEATLVSPDDLGTVTISDVAPTTDEYQTRVTGTIASTFTAEVEYAGVAIIARDTTGTIIDAATGYVDVVPAEGSAPFEVEFFRPLPGDATIEVYAYL